MFSALRRLYKWVLSLADTKWGVHAMCAVAFTEVLFFPVPPDVLLVSLSLGKPKRSFFYAFLCSVFSAMGAALGYIIGHFFWEITKGFFLTYVFSEEAFRQASELFNKYSFLTFFIVGFSPLPDKVFTVSAGVFSVNFPIYLISLSSSRAMRFFLVSSLIYFFGERIVSFIDKYFNIITIVFALIIIAGFIILKII